MSIYFLKISQRIGNFKIAVENWLSVLENELNRMGKEKINEKDERLASLIKNIRDLEEQARECYSRVCSRLARIEEATSEKEKRIEARGYLDIVKSLTKRLERDLVRVDELLKPHIGFKPSPKDEIEKFRDLLLMVKHTLDAFISHYSPIVEAIDEEENKISRIRNPRLGFPSNS